MPKGQLPTRNPQLQLHVDHPKDSKTGLPLTYGQHWSLHPNAFKETDDWFGMSYGKQEYLIEKEVPVEDIDWFRTLISCLFFKDAEFEIIMNPMTYIAETIDEPHLYLETEYPLRLYHGTSVHNWQAIQATGELRTGCLASSEGYDIDMPSTYIDLAIDEIEDDHPDVNHGGVVLKITFPSKASRRPVFKADTDV